MLTRLGVTLLFLLMSVQICAAENDAVNISEYDLKAVCLYNFTHFAYWPTVKEPKKDESISIGVVGHSPFGSAFEDLQSHLQEAGKKNFTIIYHGPYQDGMDLRKSHLLFISSSEKKNIGTILASLRGAPVLTVSDMDGFLEAGGMINLIVRNNRVRWAINRAALILAELNLNAKLLQLAVRVVDHHNQPGSHYHEPVDNNHRSHPLKAFALYPARPPQPRWCG